ncbi:MAG: N-acetyltransferase [Actinobacteria bacterium]|nr:N-acetyltransferase [Actinomycetota bacterium]
MQLRHATSADRDQIASVTRSAFEEGEDGPVARVLEMLERTDAVRASLVATEDDRIVGHVQLNRSWIDARERLVDVLVLSPLSVAPDRQGQGIGTALVAAAIAEAERLGDPAVFLEGGWDYYGERGFRRASEVGFSRPSPRIPDRAFQVALLPSWQAWMVGSLVYCEAFWATDTVGLRDPLLAQIEARSAGSPTEEPPQTPASA